jgi:Domain of unknown function (DUF1906)
VLFFPVYATTHHRHIHQKPQKVTPATPSKSSSSRHRKSVTPVTPLESVVTRNTRVYRCRRSRSLRHSANFELTLFPSDDYKLFCISEGPNPSVSIKLRTLSQKPPGWGVLLPQKTRPSAPQRFRAIIPPLRSPLATRHLPLLAYLLLFLSIAPRAGAQTTTSTYLGFDRNTYPGDAAMKLLRHDFVFTGYWLSPPPGEKTNTWKGRRDLLLSQGFGFVALYRGPDSKDLKSDKDAATEGGKDAADAVASAKAEGFPSNTIIFLDIEEGGRLPATYHAYLRAWADGLARGSYRGGVYCSGMPVNEGHGVKITTADDIRASEPSAGFLFWIYNDACPPSPGCSAVNQPPAPGASGIAYATVWQFAQSPRRKEFTARCKAKYAADGNCYAPSDTAHQWFLDLNSATSPDPSSPASARK